jgi:hypothetical protein
VAGLVGVLGSSAALTACDDDIDILDPLPIVEDVVLTFRDTTFNFNSLRTFAMPDTVVHFSPLTGTPLPVSRANDRVALDRTRQNLLARGYTEVADPATTRPDFVMLVGATASEHHNAWVGYPWFGVWGFYPGWGWFAPGFTNDWTIVYPWFPAVGVTSYERGTLILDLIPTVTVNPQARSIRSAWAGVATGILDGTHTATTIEVAIDRMFVLSPYLIAPQP